MKTLLLLMQMKKGKMTLKKKMLKKMTMTKMTMTKMTIKKMKKKTMQPLLLSSQPFPARRVRQWLYGPRGTGVGAYRISQ